MFSKKALRIAVIICVLLAAFFIFFSKYQANRAYGNITEVKRCILENDHQKLHKLLKKETNKKYVRTDDVSRAMEQGYLEVIREISVHSRITNTITEIGVEKAINNEHLNVVKYILGTPSLQHIVFERRRLLRIISDCSKMMRECMTSDVLLCLLKCKDDVLDNIMTIPKLKKHISAWIVDYIANSQSIEDVKHWNHLSWLLVDKNEIDRLLKDSSVEKVVSILECEGVAEKVENACLLRIMSAEDGKILLKAAFMENKHSRLREILIKHIRSRRSRYVEFVTLMLENGKSASASSRRLSYTDICDLSMDSIEDMSDRAVVERLSSTSALDAGDILSVYKQILFRRKVRTDRDEFRRLSQGVLERLHECFCKEEAETEVELVARQLERKDKQIPLSTHVFCMVYDEYCGRHCKSDGLIRNVLYDNNCGLCRGALIDEKPHVKEDSVGPECPVCENNYDTRAECSKVVYTALACGHVYHSRCLMDWRKSDQFDNECLYELCQKPVFLELNEKDVEEIRERNAFRNKVLEVVSEIIEMANEVVSLTMQDPQNYKTIQSNIRSNAALHEVEKLVYLKALKHILAVNKKKLETAGIYDDIVRELGFSEKELYDLQLKYSRVSWSI